MILFLLLFQLPSIYTKYNSWTGMMWNCKALSPPPPYQFRKCSSVIVYQHGWDIKGELQRQFWYFLLLSPSISFTRLLCVVQWCWAGLGQTVNISWVLGKYFTLNWQNWENKFWCLMATTRVSWANISTRNILLYPVNFNDINRPQTKSYLAENEHFSVNSDFHWK